MLAVGPVPMMRAVAQLTAPLGIKTMVSLNSIMVDGTGMCGGCRVLLGNQSKFACVDGPEFDASIVNFEVLMQRNARYREKECEALKRFEENKVEELARIRAQFASRGDEPMAEKNVLPINQRLKIVRTPMPELDPEIRSRNFEEVNQGLAAGDAQIEASRCIACAKPGCEVECPVGVKIREVVDLIYAGDYLAAAAKMREDNSLPAITGRVCPQETQCEGACLLGKKGEPVAIGNLERFIADYRAQERTDRSAGQRARHRQECRHRRQRPGGPQRRRRPGPEGPSGTGLRSAAQTRRRAGVRHSGVPPAQGDCERRGGQPAQDGRGV